MIGNLTFGPGPLDTESIWPHTSVFSGPPLLTDAQRALLVRLITNEVSYSEQCLENLYEPDEVDELQTWIKELRAIAEKLA